MARGIPFTITLGGLAAAGPLGVDMYIAALPAIAGDFDTSVSAAQLSVTGFLLGIVFGQLVFGPLGDRFGRRRLLLLGTTAAAVCALACAVAPTIEVFIAARMLAGFFGAAGIVLARAVITDLFHGPKMARYFAGLAMLQGSAPVLAPALGGLIMHFGSWRVVFAVLTGISVVLTLAILRFVPETLPPERRTTHGLGLGALLRQRRFAGHVAVIAFAAVALFTYISDSSFVFELGFGVSPTVYSLIFASNACAMLAASSVFGALANRFAPPVMLRAGLVLATTATAVHLILTEATGGGLAVTWVCLLGTLAGLGLIFPATTTIAQSLGAATPGAASALLGAGQFTLGAVLSPLSGLFSSSSPVPMGLFMLGGMLCAGVAYVAVTPRGAGSRSGRTASTS
jgi:DHA1 family bicyclomycin/chloramphenicol resistance-like MFS transporter